MSDHSGYSKKDVQREVTELRAESATAARIFDLRRIIGGLFVLYGAIVTIAGTLLLGIFFLVWLKVRPTVQPAPGAGEGEGRGE